MCELTSRKEGGMNASQIKASELSVRVILINYILQYIFVFYYLSLMSLTVRWVSIFYVQSVGSTAVENKH